MIFGIGNLMTVEISRKSNITTSNITGLAGHQEDGYYIMRNETTVSENASALRLFGYAETCMS
jgi:hypothetical protein